MARQDDSEKGTRMDSSIVAIFFVVVVLMVCEGMRMQTRKLLLRFNLSSPIDSSCCVFFFVHSFVRSFVLRFAREANIKKNRYC